MLFFLNLDRNFFKYKEILNSHAMSVHEKG